MKFCVSGSAESVKTSLADAFKETTKKLNTLLADKCQCKGVQPPLKVLQIADKQVAIEIKPLQVVFPVDKAVTDKNYAFGKNGYNLQYTVMVS